EALLIGRPPPVMNASPSEESSTSDPPRGHYDIFGQIGSDLCRSPPGSRLTSLLDPISSIPTQTATAPDDRDGNTHRSRSPADRALGRRHRRGWHLRGRRRLSSHQTVPRHELHRSRSAGNLRRHLAHPPLSGHPV